MKTQSIVILFLLSLIINFSCTDASKSDLLIHNGKIYTADKETPIVEAVVVTDSKIVFAGSYKEAKNFQDPHTSVIDLDGRTMTPGFIDAHAHFLSIGYGKMKLDLTTTETYDDLVKRVKIAAEKAKPGEWITGRGWHQSKWSPGPEKMVRGFQTHEKLSKVSPDNPVFLTHASGHAVFVNEKAMEIAGISGSTKAPDGGEIIRDSKGNATGIFTETAEDLVYRHLPKTTREKRRRGMRLAMEECLKYGLTGFHDAGSGKTDIEIYKEFLSNGELKIRLNIMLSGDSTGLLEAYFAKGPEIGLGNHFLTIRSIKLYADGALGSRGAWLLEPYSDREETSGLPTNPMTLIGKIANQGLKYGFQVCTHAIGDRGNREVLDQYEKAFANFPEVKDHRFRIEHAQHLSASDIPRFAQLGVIPAMQAIHMSSDMPWAIERLGPERIAEGAYVWRSLLKSGAVIPNGTDAPVEPVNPLASFYASVSRKTLKGEQREWFHPEQAMTRDQALASYTIYAAYAGFDENIKGSITVGKLADFTIFDKDIMTVPEMEILNTKVEMTIVNGEIVYEAENLNL